jgi:tetratricopeptide (TPR) repeat protein
MTERQEEDEIVRGKSAENYKKDGDKYRQQRKWQKAVEAYNKTIELDNDDFRSHERRGRAYFKLGDYHQAVINLTRAIEI